MKAREKGIELLLHYSSKVPQGFIGDAGRLRQVVTNLVSNAIKFTEDGHVAVLITGAEASAQTWDLRIEVRDTGIGIPEDKLDTVFSAFEQAEKSTTRKYGGTGLGLAISKQILELMDGDIFVESQPGIGSSFICKIPLPLCEDVPEAAADRHFDFTGQRVLIVDDLELNRRILSERLGGWGLICVCCESAGAALQQLEVDQANGQNFDLALIDYQMPGMNGDELAIAIKQNAVFEDLPLILIS